MPDPSHTQLSVVVPAYNEEARLPATLESVLDFLAGQPFSSEVIVVDDGSTDATAQVPGRLAQKGMPIRLLQHPDGRNHGKGAAVRLGMLESCSRYRLFMDADNSTTINHIDRFWPEFAAGFDVVIGSRSIAGSHVAVHQARHKEIAGKLGNRFIQALATPGIRDTQAGFKMFTARAALETFRRQTIERWGYDVELLVIARALGMRVKEVPITWVNAPGSKVRWHTYLAVLAEVWRVHRNLRRGLYR